ncbi:MAG: YeeE/YedE family protein [Deltaproteobacteria bacterium]|nr:YeeE/YedE family protein [Deltaproteobacteria bacterium]
MVNGEFVMPLLGGVLIGVSSGIMLLFNGRTTGISGIFSGLLFKRGNEETWRSYFLAGLIFGGFVLQYLNPELFENTTGRGLLVLVTSGVLVGIGSKLGRGCTSGHGVCGIGRLSVTSLVATVVFVLSGMFLVSIVQPFYN